MSLNLELLFFFFDYFSLLHLTKFMFFLLLYPVFMSLSKAVVLQKHNTNKVYCDYYYSTHEESPTLS